MTTAVVTPEVDIAKIDVVDGRNARKRMDKDELQRLADTIKESGLVQPISVAPKEDGRYDVVAGHRRLEAAKKAGLTKVKVTVSEGNPHAEAFYENNQRADLNPIETALGLKALAEEFNLETKKKIGAKAGKSEQWVRAGVEGQGHVPTPVGATTGPRALVTSVGALSIGGALSGGCCSNQLA